MTRGRRFNDDVFFESLRQRRHLWLRYAGASILSAMIAATAATAEAPGLQPLFRLAIVLGIVASALGAFMAAWVYVLSRAYGPEFPDEGDRTAASTEPTPTPDEEFFR